MPRNQSLNERYDIYKRRYLDAQASVSKRGGKMEHALMNKRAFAEVYERVKRQRDADVSSGVIRRKADVNIYQEIIKAAKYGKRYDAIKQLQSEGALNVGIRKASAMSWDELRDQSKDYINWDVIKEHYKRLKSMTGSSATSKKFISQHYFGSPV